MGYRQGVAGTTPPARGRPRVLLREPTLGDEAEWLSRMRASRRYHAPWIQMPVTPDADGAYVARDGEPRREQRIVVRLDDHALVGFVNVSEVIRGKLSSAFLGYGGIAEIRAEQWRAWAR